MQPETPISPISRSSTACESEDSKEPKKLVLCFDGTGNKFSGSNADTNVVKLLSKLDRNDPNQYHYYQTGIGTYDINEKTVHKSWYGEMCSSISQTIDQGIGTTFDAHVMAGYRFLMRYYDSGDKIYMFGFSRGAFTAKFLARMIHTVGLLCKGNEEMVPFAYRLYQRYLAGEIDDHDQQTIRRRWRKMRGKANDDDGAASDDEAQHFLKDDDTVRIFHGRQYEVARDEITAFSDTFCRKEQVICRNGRVKEKNIKVFFLGVWDCVNSISVFEPRTPIPVPIKGTATYVRHAVAVDERRVKFKPALLAQDIRALTKDHEKEDIKEVWFPGCHGDVGGGWPAEPPESTENKPPPTIWQRLRGLGKRIRGFWRTSKAKEPTKAKDLLTEPFQMSDIPLSWMIREVEMVGRQDPRAAVKWRPNVEGFKQRFKQRKQQALDGVMHDALKFGQGTGVFTVLLWKFMEIFPFITRWELEDNEWVNVRFPMNKGSTRDIPPDAVLHESLVYRLQKEPNYSPANNHGGKLPPCLKNNGIMAELEPVVERNWGLVDPDHQTYKFKRVAVQPKEELPVATEEQDAGAAKAKLL
ncbi:hypothetical protein jhhlp_005408 [Lomentospora prolificans]|uniref:T6SS Phospholipase effector Tle1-like catalytic domain-containing protein n=1 Tax=Lomentospora prolificans TaxID=41688 RepID=A0A2N3N6Q9_9PEZI|nr:hypothetical protein jhhlp_005408 [Lomentospora prolificans]